MLCKVIPVDVSHSPVTMALCVMMNGCFDHGNSYITRARHDACTSSPRFSDPYDWIFSRLQYIKKFMTLDVQMFGNVTSPIVKC